MPDKQTVSLNYGYDPRRGFGSRGLTALPSRGGEKYRISLRGKGKSWRALPMKRKRRQKRKSRHRRGKGKVADLGDRRTTKKNGGKEVVSVRKERKRTPALIKRKGQTNLRSLRSRRTEVRIRKVGAKSRPSGRDFLPAWD